MQFMGGNSMSKLDIILQGDEYMYNLHQNLQQETLCLLQNRVKMELAEIWLLEMEQIDFTETFQTAYSLYKRENFLIPYEEFCEELKRVVTTLLKKYDLDTSKWNGSIVMLSSV